MGGRPEPTGHGSQTSAGWRFLSSADRICNSRRPVPPSCPYRTEAAETQFGTEPVPTPISRTELPASSASTAAGRPSPWRRPVWLPAVRRALALVLAGLAAAAGALLRGVVYTLASPAIILADLVQPEPRFDRNWALGFMTLVTMMILLSWGFGFLVTVETLRGNTLMATYTELGDDLRSVPHIELIQVYAARNGLDPALVAAVIAEESGFSAVAVSPAGARGLMQIMPSTWRSLDPTSSCLGGHTPPACGPHCIFDPEANIQAGTKFFAGLLKEFEGNYVLAFAAYNAGPAAVRHHAEGAVSTGLDDLPPFAETRSYVSDVLSFWVRLRTGSVPDVLTLSAEECRLLRQVATAMPAVVLGLWGVFAIWVVRRLGHR